MRHKPVVVAHVVSDAPGMQVSTYATAIFVMLAFGVGVYLVYNHYST